MSKEIIIIYILYLGLNVLNTCIITHKELNKYLVPFKHTFRGEINSVFGNLFALNLIGFIFMLFTKNLYWFLLILVIFTGIINLLLFVNGVFNLYFGSAFTKESFEIFKNPAKGISKGLPQEILKDLIVYYRIILFIPFFVLLFLLISMGKINLIEITIPINGLGILIGILISLLIIIFAWFNYEKMYKKDLTVKAVKSIYGIQNYGIYPFYLSELFRFASIPDQLIKRKKKNTSETFADYQSFNKNQKCYTNFINNKVYSNDLKLSNISKNITINKSLIKDDKSLSGILTGKNLVLVQMESMSRFLLDIPLLKNEFSFIRTLLEESVEFTDFYTSVGVGVSSDAEITTLTGLYPTGYNSLYWSKYDLKQKAYTDHKDLTALPKYFREKGYFTEAIHGDSKEFYNREHAYPEIMGFDNFYALDSFKDKKIAGTKNLVELYSYEYQKGKHHVSPWASDYQVFDTVRNKIKKFKQPTVLFPITMMPHIPFEYYPKKDKPYVTTEYRLKEITKKYIRFADYYDDIIRRVFFDEKGTLETDSNTVYFFYGDHGCGIKNGDIAKLFETKLTSLEERKKLLQIVGFLYVPGTKEIKKNGYMIKEGLIKGKQNLVRGQMDVYRTIIEMFGLETKQNAYFGTHLLSDEPTFILDNKLQDVVTDNVFFSMRNRYKTFPENFKIDNKTFNHVRDYKILNDILIEENGVQSKLNQMIVDSKK